MSYDVFLPGNFSDHVSHSIYLFKTEYLLEKYGDKERDYPHTEQGKLDNLYFSHYAEGTLMPLLVNKLIFILAPGMSLPLNAF